MKKTVILAGIVGCALGVVGTLLLSQVASAVYASEIRAREEQELSLCGYQGLSAGQWAKAEQCIGDYLSLKSARAHLERGKDSPKWPLLFPVASLVLSELPTSPIGGGTALVESGDIAIHSAMLGFAIESSGTRTEDATEAYQRASKILRISVPEARDMAAKTLKEFQRQ